MKPLKEFLIETRQVMGELYFDKQLFVNFINDAIIDANYDDSIYWNGLKNIFDKYYPHMWNAFYSWCESILELKITPEEFYEKIKLIPLDRINRVLGAGSNGIVLDMGDKVIKIFYSKTIKFCDLPFLEWCSKHKSKVFPRVYKLGKNWAVMEKLKTFTPRLVKFYDMIDNVYVDGISLYEWIKQDDDKIDKSKFSKDEWEVIEWGKRCKKEMEDMKSKYITWPGDLSLKNIGERNNGEIVFFDI